MYLPLAHRLDDHEAQLDLIEAHPLGAWVCMGPEGLVANHLPFVLDRAAGRHGVLRGHVARGNPVWRVLAADRPSVVMFQGPQAYITPGWYPGKAEHGQVVPTWNYVAVHAHGTARVIDDQVPLRALLDRLTEAQEAARPVPWRIDDAPAPYIERLLRGIVGIEIPIDRLEGKLKASQDEAREDRIGTVLGLRQSGCPAAAAMASLVQRALDGD